jgi:hypothetical protein
MHAVVLQVITACEELGRLDHLADHLAPARCAKARRRSSSTTWSSPPNVGRASPLTFSDDGGGGDDDDDDNATNKKAVGKAAAAVASQPSPSSTVCDCGCAFSPSCVSCSNCGKKRHALSRVSFLKGNNRFVPSRQNIIDTPEVSVFACACLTHFYLLNVSISRALNCTGA